MINQELLARVKAIPDISFGEDKDFTLQNLIRQMEDEIAVFKRALELASNKAHGFRQWADTLSCSSCFVADDYKMCDRDSKGELYNNCPKAFENYFIQQAKAELAKE